LVKNSMRSVMVSPGLTGFGNLTAITV